MKKQTPRLQRVTVLPDLVVSAIYTDGRTVTVSMRDIGLSRRTISQYRTGARPVPRVVALACKGWSNDHLKEAA